MEFTAEVKAYLDEHFDLLSTKDDITTWKEDIFLVREKIQDQEKQMVA